MIFHKIVEKFSGLVLILYQYSASDPQCAIAALTAAVAGPDEEVGESGI